VQAGGVNLGDVDLGDTLAAAVVMTDGSGTPQDPTIAPVFRIYGQGPGPMANGLGSLSKLDANTVSGATNATPIVVTTTIAHGLQTGDKVTISGVNGNTSANGSFSVTVASATTFSLDGSAGNGPWTSGGSTHLSGLYLLTLPANPGDGYLAGVSYRALISWAIAGANYSCLCPFRVT
jgi:hypothetical protein